MRRGLRRLLVLGAFLPGVLAAQERERIALVAFGPTLQRVGVLVPLNERWMLRGDIAGSIGRDSGAEYWEVIPGISLIRRSAPTEQGWIYGVLRYGLHWEKYSGQSPYLVQIGTVGAGGHAQLLDWFALFGEGGAAVTYFEEGATGSKRVHVTATLITRMGLAIRRPALRR